MAARSLVAGAMVIGWEYYLPFLEDLLIGDGRKLVGIFGQEKVHSCFFLAAV
jgi:hypothetical protein